MSDALVCTRCGIACTYADAYIADLEESCERTIEVAGHVADVPSEHDWAEPVHPEIDVV